MGYRKALVPVSGKYRLQRATRALDQALRIMSENGEICFLHCMHEVPYLIAGEAHRKLVMEDAREAEALFAPLVERVKDTGLTYSAHIVEGSPVTRISKFAAENGVDVVVMFTGGHDALGNLMANFVMGSVTERVLHTINVPLLVVP